MSAEQTPQYHYRKHLQDYDTESPKKVWGSIGMLTEMLDDILYADNTTIRANSARASAQLFESQFRYKFPRQEVSTTGLSMTPEFLEIGIDHTKYLGKSAVKQCYKVKVESSIRNFYRKDDQIVTLLGRITTLYNFQEMSQSENMYQGTVMRPHFNIYGSRENGYDEPVTVYDCESLGYTLSELVDIIRMDQDHATKHHDAA